MRTILPQSLLFCFAFLSAGTGSAQAPFNDDFSNAYVITAFPSTTTGTTLDATLEIDEPFTDAWVEGSVWFTWVATTTATIQVDTGGSASDPVIQIFSGTTLTSLTSIIENSRFDDQISSLALFEATEGTTYQIAVYGSYGWSSPGSFLLHLTNQIGAKISGHVISTESGLPLTNSAVTIFRWHEGYWYFHQFA
ncbi:MAG: hypothetical protein KDL31_02620 [Kiritimatiellae bacterium]|nr:hypothetical protein [Kiritimatiellia bacterium]